MKQRSNINDNKIRLVMIPFFGIAIPNLTGLFGQLSFNSPFYWIGYLYFISLSFSIWQGNRYLLFKQRKYFDWFSNPYRKIVVLIAANVFYTAPLTILWLIGWYRFAPFENTNWGVVYLVTLMNVIAVLFITQVYETVFLIKEREEDIREVEQLKRANIEKELMALKNQIDPHFMFNSLNTLSHLIETSPEKASLYNDDLSDFYRYILMNKDKNLIQLKDELDFTESYFNLLKIRFEKGIMLDLKIEKEKLSYLLPPISLQTLIENAVKHNEFDSSHPLRISFCSNGSRLVISNNRKLKNSQSKSSKIGLINLDERCRLLMGKSIEITESDELFTVKVPLIKSEV